MRNDLRGSFVKTYKSVERPTVFSLQAARTKPWLAFLLGLSLSTALSPRLAVGQPPDATTPDAATPDITQDDVSEAGVSEAGASEAGDVPPSDTQPSAQDETPTVSDADAAAVELVSQLGAATFAQREKATGEILRIGMPMVPYLRAAMEQGGDAELMLRASTTLARLTSGNFEARVTAFLAGKDFGGDFEGWLTVQATLGDSPAIRELFVQILRIHPELVASLDGSTRDRNVALDQAATKIQTNMFQRHQFPTLADGVALLLPLVDPGVAISGGYEATLVSVMQKHMETIRRDALLRIPVSGLMNQWVKRSRIENRSDVLYYSMQWDLDAASTLGVRTLGETSDVETLQTAMQAISRFGTKADAESLAKFIEDKRPANTRAPITVDGEPLDVTLGDVALASIAVIYHVPLQEIGMTQGELHPKVGFIIDNAGFVADATEARAKSIAQVRKWLSGEVIPGQPRL